MFCIGITVESDPKLKESIQSLSLRFLLLPLGTAFGTFLGAIFAFLFLSYSLYHCLAVTANSLSSVIVTHHLGAELGTVALISTLLRETLTLLLVPVIAKFIPEQATISMGGVSTLDITLPILTKTLGTS